MRYHCTACQDTFTADEMARIVEDDPTEFWGQRGSECASLVCPNDSDHDIEEITEYEFQQRELA